jgi:bifunctional enzyme CysN/CysC
MNIRLASPATADARPLVHIVTVGHVDHGKSTLIGRLLHETGSLPDGKMEALEAVAARRGMPFEWSFLLDALQTERDHGITIDTSQIHLRTPARDIVLIDAPGHTEFLRNMITGASQADAAVLIVDAAEGVRDQTRRHGYLLHLLGIRQVAVVVNKMDKVDFDAERFRRLEAEMSAYLDGLGIVATAIIPVSARNGDGVTRRTPAIAWYAGVTVIEALDAFTPAPRPADHALRLPVQAIYKFDDRRIVAGRIETGHIAVGDEIAILPSGRTARVRSIETWPAADGAATTTASAGRSIGITLDRELFVDRGDIVAAAAVRPAAARRLRARVFWLHQEPLVAGTTLTVKIGTGEARATIVAIDHATDPGTLDASDTNRVGQNQVGDITLTLARPLAADIHAVNPRTGRVVLEHKGRIAGGGLVLAADPDDARVPKATNVVAVGSAVSPQERAARFGHGGAVLWLTGRPAAGKSTLARALERHLFERGGVAVLVDGDTMRTGLNADLGFAASERTENVRRLAEVAAHLARSGLVAIVAAVSPIAADRARARATVGDGFYEIHVSAPPEVCEQRDPKGHYRKARAGGIAGFTGVDGGYEEPEAPDLVVDTSVRSVEQAVADLARLVAGSPVLNPFGRGHEFTI